MVGTTLARKYRILRLLGEGGMGCVYEAQHLGTLRRVAIKVINARLLTSRGGGAHRFRREAKAASAIESEHIVRIFDSGDDESSGTLYLAMELLQGEDLQRLIDRCGPLPPDTALRIGAQALLALERAQEARIVHRDIKPANLFLARGRDGEITVKLLDFGIAKIRAEPLSLPHTTGLTGTGSFLGSPLYMSPEQVESSRDVDFRSDLWSLGSALYCALSGRAPHQSAASVSKLFVSICTSPVPPLQEVAPWVPREVAEVVHGALRIKPEERYPSAAAMLAAVRALLPGGLALREEMLVPAEGAPPARAPAPARAAERAESDEGAPPSGESTVSLQGTPGGGAGGPPRTATDGPPRAATDGPPRAATDGPPRAAAGGHAAPPPAPEAPAPSRAGRSAPLAARSRLKRRAAAAVGAVLAAGAWAASAGVGPSSKAGPPVERLSAAVRGRAAGISAPGAAPQARPAASVAGSASALERRHVSLAILPEDALVEVDGAPAAVQGGAVRISGLLGSGHRVRVSRGRRELVRDVFVTDAGAVPPRLELPGTRRPAPPAAKPGATPPAAAPAEAPPRSPEDELMPPVEP
ncbi:serine/threonine-protein kinase [Sorangium sp. So ce1389]|uniref:serine/threonine-protein kinase n=1 Tax=Sorangium sp. So ce1389 TaxID=3133336 RepID=UPI003F60A8D5